MYMKRRQHKYIMSSADPRCLITLPWSVMSFCPSVPAKGFAPSKPRPLSRFISYPQSHRPKSLSYRHPIDKGECRARPFMYITQVKLYTNDNALETAVQVGS
jgi:hypothetical protein